MKVVVIGTGDMGGAIASSIAQRTTHVVCARGSRPGSASARSLVSGSRGRITEARDDDIATADLVIVAVPWSSVPDVTTLLTGTEARRVVSVIVPWTGDNATPAVGRDNSAAEILARAVPAARVAGAFTSVASASIRKIESYRERPTVFVVGDDPSLKATVLTLAKEMGFDSLDAGPLYAARFTEALGFLWTAAAFEGGAGEMIAFRAVLPE
jgi:predicted dinucleotide-binding enzyme